MHKFQIGQMLWANASGKQYEVLRLRSDAHYKLKGEIGYDVIGHRNGERYGPSRIMRESSLDDGNHGMVKDGPGKVDFVNCRGE